jgi:hypothetical protein
VLSLAQALAFVAVAWLLGHRAAGDRVADVPHVLLAAARVPR